MKQRCTNPNYTHYEYYGGRGIKVCQRWLDSFENFLADMGIRPEDTTLDRIDSDKDYTVDNCSWASSEEQADNKRSSKKYYYKGRLRALKEIASMVGSTRKQLYSYLYKGNSLKQSIKKSCK